MPGAPAPPVVIMGAAGAGKSTVGAALARIATRLRARPAHCFPPALLGSQLAALEEPADAIVVDATLPVEAIVAAILSTT